MVTGVDGPVVSLTERATGQSTLLGKTAVFFEGVYDTSTFTFHGTFAEVAANGDCVYGTYEGGATGPTTVAGTLTFTGGTGRFRGATGRASFVNTVDLLTGAGTTAVEGWLAF